MARVNGTQLNSNAYGCQIRAFLCCLCLFPLNVGNCFHLFYVQISTLAGNISQIAFSVCVFPVIPVKMRKFLLCHRIWKGQYFHFALIKKNPYHTQLHNSVAINNIFPLTPKVVTHVAIENCNQVAVQKGLYFIRAELSTRLLFLSRTTSGILWVYWINSTSHLQLPCREPSRNILSDARIIFFRNEK